MTPAEIAALPKHLSFLYSTMPPRDHPHLAPAWMLQARNAIGDAAALLDKQAEDARDAWRPIATAPKDGTRIWACFADGSQAAAMYESGRWRFFGYRLSAPNGQPTHWQPLPAPPTAPLAGGYRQSLRK